MLVKSFLQENLPSMAHTPLRAERTLPRHPIQTRRGTQVDIFSPKLSLKDRKDSRLKAENSSGSLLLKTTRLHFRLLVMTMLPPHTVYIHWNPIFSQGYEEEPEADWLAGGSERTRREREEDPLFGTCTSIRSTPRSFFAGTASRLPSFQALSAP